MRLLIVGAGGFIGVPLAQHLTNAGTRWLASRARPPGPSLAFPMRWRAISPDTYILVSSGDVYRNYGGLLRKEEAQPIFDAMGEEAPLRASRYPYRGAKPRPDENPDRWLDDYDKIPTEANVVARSGIDWTILRLPMVFGTQDRQHRFGWLIRPLAAGAEHIAMPRPCL